MKRLSMLISIVLMSVTMMAQTLNVVQGNVTYAFPASQCGEMNYAQGTTCTIINKVFTLSEVDNMFIDNSSVTDNTVEVAYNGNVAKVRVAGNIAQYINATVNGAHVNIDQGSGVSDETGEITYTLSGASDDGEFYMTGSYKATIELNGITLTNATPVFSGAAINIMDGKRIALSVKKDTENTLRDAASGTQKSALYCKGHLELKGKGTLNVYGTLAHAIKSAEYMQMKNCTVNVKQAVKDGISCDEYFLMESGALTISGVGDDAIQADIDGTTSTGETSDHEDEDSGNIYIEDGTVSLTVTANAAKGFKAGGDVRISGGTINVTQTGSIIADSDLSYPTSIKADGNIHITGGNITIANTADGGKGISADGAVTIDETNATVTIDITANGKGGTAETTGSTEPETTASYKVYVSLPTTGGGGMGPGGTGNSAWRSIYLYKSDGTLVKQLTSTVTRSNGMGNTTFYYYDFGAADTNTYYFKSDNYTSRNTTYTIRSATFSGPSSGSDIYYSISNSYTTSGTTRTYSLSNVTSTYSGTTDVSEDSGTSYNAIGIKADGNITIDGGNITVKNSGAMSKSMKSKATATINGGNITLTPSGAMQVINSDASYSSGIKAVDFIQNDGLLTINASSTAGRGITSTNIITNGGTLKINNTGAGQQGSSDDYTAKGLKADNNIQLLAGTITIAMTGTGGKGIKSNGTYTQGTSDGSGPTLTVSTTGSRLGSSSGAGGDPWGGGQSSGGGSAKGIKVQGAIVIYGGTTEVSTKTDGAEGLESKTSIDIQGGQHYFACYDDCINSSGAIYFNGGTTVCYSNGNDAVDSNYGRTGAITIGNGTVFAYTTKGSPEEGLDCDNNSYIQITGTGYAISAGGSQGGGGGWGGSSSSTISNAKQGYAFVTTSISYAAGRYYTLADASGNNLITYSFPASCSSSLALFTAKGMVKGSSYNIKYSTTAPTDATTAWHGLYLGSSHKGTTSVTSFTAN